MAGVTQTIESLFGPPSDLICIADFIRSATTILPGMEPLPEQNCSDRDSEEECSVDDIKHLLERMLDEPMLSAHMVKDHETTVCGLYSTSAKKNKKAGGRKNTRLRDPEDLPPEVIDMQKELDGVKLKSWKLNVESAMFIRPPRNSDHNSIANIKSTTRSDGGQVIDSSEEAVVTISIFNKIPWGPSYVSRICQHAYLSSQTLQDIYEALPCIYSASASRANPAEMKPGCAMCIENVIYSDSADYSNQMSRHMETTRKATSRPAISPNKMSETRLSFLSLRINFPYPISHAGNCEHFMVVEQIRLFHPSDPLSGYPQTLQMVPPLPSLCLSCHKVPAALSVVGDVRLGESPSLLCGPCWRGVGPEEEEGVVVTPLPLSYCS